MEYRVNSNDFSTLSGEDFSTETSEELSITLSPPQYFQPEEPYVPPLQSAEPPQPSSSPEAGFKRMKYLRKRPVLVSI